MSDRNFYPAGQKTQGSDEEIAYSVDLSDWGTVAASPAPTCTLTNLTTNTTCTTANLSGSVTLVGNVITTPKVVDLSRNTDYRLGILATVNTNLMSGYLDIKGE